MNKGVIYILTNPSFPEYVKIGYADDIEKRLRQLNRSETIPFAFRVYAIYEVDSRLTDLKVHDLIDRLNSDLRTIETFDGKKRQKEFYAMTAEEAYTLLDCIAQISGTSNRLKKMKPEGHEIADEEIAKEEKVRKAPFQFSMCNIPVGSKIYSLEFPDKFGIVVDDKHIEYEGEIMSLTACAKKISNKKWIAFAGPQHFTFEGRILSDIRNELENNI